MEIIITIPTVDEVIQKGMPLSVVGENESWLRAHLGPYARESGVYIHHFDNQILYVGQTSKTSKWGNFEVRLRRECQPKAASNSALYQLLFRYKDRIKTSMYSFAEVRKMFNGSIKDKLTDERLTLILEQFMIAAYNPVGNKK